MSIEYKVVIPSTVKMDIEEIVVYYQQERMEYARQIFDKLVERIRSLSILPEKGRIVPELGKNNIVAFRELIESYWRIIYRIDGNMVIVLAVIDGRRNVDDLLIKKLKRKIV